MNPRQKTIRDLISAGYTELIHGAKHDRYKNPKAGKSITLKRHDFNENDRNCILREIRKNENMKQ